MQRAREAVAVRAAHTDAVRQVRLVDQDAARRVERVIAGRGQVIGELLDARLVGDRGVRVGRAGRRVGRILAPRAVHLVHRLGGGVVRLHVLVGDGPGRRQAVMVVQFAEVLLAHPVQRGPVQLGGAADEVMHLRLVERLGLRVVPAVGRDVTALHEHVLGGPVRRLARQPVAALEQQDALARGGEVAGERAAARPGPDDDDVVMLAHAGSFPKPVPAIACRCCPVQRSAVPRGSPGPLARATFSPNPGSPGRWSVPERVGEHHDGPGADGDVITGGSRRGGGAAGCRRVVGVDLGPPGRLRPGGREDEVERLPPGVDQDEEVVVEQRRAVGGPVGVVGSVQVDARWPGRSGRTSRRRSSRCPPG